MDLLVVPKIGFDLLCVPKTSSVLMKSENWLP